MTYTVSLDNVMVIHAGYHMKPAELSSISTTYWPWPYTSYWTAWRQEVCFKLLN